MRTSSAKGFRVRVRVRDDDFLAVDGYAGECEELRFEDLRRLGDRVAC